MEKFKNKYRIPSARLAGWDYGQPGLYYITICTKNRDHFFGEIINGEIFLNAIGVIANNCWSEIQDHYKNTTLGEFVIMPNHVHGIIIIDNVETGHDPSLRRNTISNMVGSFKSAVTKISRPINSNFGWQSRFYDHIIRSHDDFVRISNYIKNNPANWDSDKLYNR